METQDRGNFRAAGSVCKSIGCPSKKQSGQEPIAAPPRQQLARRWAEGFQSLSHSRRACGGESTAAERSEAVFGLADPQRGQVSAL